MVALAFAAGALQGQEEAQLRMRQQIRDSFHCRPEAQPKSQDTDEPVQASQSRVDAEIVILPKMDVTTHSVDRKLAEAIAKGRSSRPVNTTRFGTGVRTKDFGKVRAGVVTLFYVPVAFGFSW